MQQWIRETKWHQGSIVFTKDCHLFANHTENTIALVISHDCDIANDNLSSEPFIEFIYGKIVAEIIGNLEFAKNPRILHLNATLNTNPVVFEGATTLMAPQARGGPRNIKNPYQCSGRDK